MDLRLSSWGIYGSKGFKAFKEFGKEEYVLKWMLKKKSHLNKWRLVRRI